MKLSEYIEAFGLGELSARMSKPPSLFSQIAHGHRKASGDMALDIEHATDGLVTVAELRAETAARLERNGYVRSVQQEACVQAPREVA